MEGEWKIEQTARTSVFFRVQEILIEEKTVLYFHPGKKLQYQESEGPPPTRFMPYITAFG